MRLRLFSVSHDHPVLRGLLLLLVFAATAAAFWWHFERRMAQIQPPPAVAIFLMDKDKLLTVDEARALHVWRTTYKDNLGIAVQVLVSAGSVEVPPFAPGTLFVGAGLAAGQAGPEAVIVLPPLARKALGEGPRITAEEELAACLRDTPPASCLEKTLHTLWRHLGSQ